MKTDTKYMEAALTEAKKALNLKEVPIGAVVVCNDKIIGRGHNLKESQNDPTAHAEIIAIKKAAEFLSSWRLNDCHLYVSIEPCPMCAGAIVQARIKRLIYGASDKKSGAVSSLYNLLQDERLNHQVDVEGGVLSAKSRNILQDFFWQLRNNKN